MGYLRSLIAAIVSLTLGGPAFPAHAKPQVLDQKPNAVIDLMTDEGVALVKGQWRYRDAKIVEVDHHAPGPDLGPSGPPNRTYDISPHAGTADFDDAAWETITGAGLETRRSSGKLCFNWYRINVTIPEKIGSFDPTGSTVVFEIIIDDYAEVWVDGKLPLVLGQTGGPLVKGFNAPNRLVVARDVKPGQRVQLAVLGANGPLSNPPGNFIWVRSATLDFYKADRFKGEREWVGDVIKVDSALDEIVPPGPEWKNWRAGLRLRKDRSGFPRHRRRLAIYCSAIPTTISFIDWQPMAKSPSSGPRADTAAGISASTISLVQTGWRWTGRAG